MIKLLTLGILFSTVVKTVAIAKLIALCILTLASFVLALRAAVVAKLVILGISPLTSFIIAFRVVSVANFVISGILSSAFLILALYPIFLTISFLLHYLVYLNQLE